MENDRVFQWTKMILDHLWLLIPLALTLYVLCRPSVLRYVSRVKFGDFELELASLKEELKDTKQKLVESHSEVRALIEKLDAAGTVSQLRDASQGLKTRAAHLSGDDLAEALAGLQPGAGPAALHAAAVIARKRTDPAALAALVECLDRLSSADDLGDIRLNTIWHLASAAHLTLVAIYKNGAVPHPDRVLLIRAKATFERLLTHPRVVQDHPENPRKGVRGPAGHALAWIETGLRQTEAAKG
jgi:hypothetical protein